MVTLGTCHDIARKGVVPSEKMDSPAELMKGFSDQSEVADTHFLFRFLSQHLSVGILVSNVGFGFGTRRQSSGVTE